MTNGLRVLSLFDGISCGLQALKQADIPVAEYHAFEIDPIAISISKYQHPEVIRHGDVRNINYLDFYGFDLLLCGSPCQDLSRMNSEHKGLDGAKSSLFYYAAKCVEYGLCRYFLFENVQGMPKKDLAIMNKLLGVQPVAVCSSSVSAQTRGRYYWTNFPWVCEKLPELKFKAQDVLESGIAPRDTYTAVCTTPDSSGNMLNRMYKQRIKQFKCYKDVAGEYLHGSLEYGKRYYNLELGQRYRLERLTAVELERLQTLPDDYTKYGIRNGKLVEIGYYARHKAIGNGWTVCVIEQAMLQLADYMRR